MSAVTAERSDVVQDLRGATACLEIMVDAGSFSPWDAPAEHGVGSGATGAGPGSAAGLAPAGAEPGADYAVALARAREKSGRDEAVTTGTATIAGRRVAVVVSDFRFLGGTIGVVTARRIAAAFRRAAAEGLPLVAAPASGGTRMQEGTHAFLAMLDIAQAVREFRAGPQPYLVYLRHPTTGGVMASWGSLGQLTFAEPGALLGFLGPTVVESVTGTPMPEGVQRAEHLVESGLVDAMVAPERIRDVLGTALGLMTPAPSAGADGAAAVPGSGSAGEGAEGEGAAGEASDAGLALVPETAWDAVTATRAVDRPRAEDLLTLLEEGHRGDPWEYQSAGQCEGGTGADAPDAVLRLSGTGEGQAESGLELALARFDGIPTVLIAQAGVPDRPLGPAALRVARRGLRLAAELGLPVVTVVDTPGATLSAAAEEGGVAGQIARTLGDLITAEVPTVSVLLGQGCGGGALALLPADRTLASSHAWITPLPPEGASVILRGTPDEAPAVAQEQGIGVRSLHRLGLVDEVVPDPALRPGDPSASRTFLEQVRAGVVRHLGELAALEPAMRRARRAERFERLTHLG